jgi:hypothetical protein
MSDSRSGGVTEGAFVAGPWRRLRAMTPRERILVWFVPKLVGALASGALSLAGGPLLGEKTGIGGAIYMATCMFVVFIYLPELVRLARRMNG